MSGRGAPKSMNSPRSDIMALKAKQTRTKQSKTLTPWGERETSLSLVKSVVGSSDCRIQI